MAQSFGVAIGYSDHTDGIAVPIAAVAMGASVIEKHITLDRSMPGPDHKAARNHINSVQWWKACTMKVHLEMGQTPTLSEQAICR